MFPRKKTQKLLVAPRSTGQNGNRFRFNASRYDLKVTLTSQLHEVARLCGGHTKVWVLVSRRSAHAVCNSLHGNYNSRETGNIEIQVAQYTPRRKFRYALPYATFSAQNNHAETQPADKMPSQPSRTLHSASIELSWQSMLTQLKAIPSLDQPPSQTLHQTMLWL
jgi:hypothetical protein